MDIKDNFIGRLLDERYEIQSVIGEGGMAVVYRALDQRLNRFVAVKIMREEMAADEEFRRRFCAESQAVAMLSNPNIVAVYDVSHSDDLEYIVMELVDGITLKQYMERKGAMAWREALHFSRQILKALAHAHERGIIHRDIKPQNIMLLRDGTIKVADFGIAALENEASEAASDGQTIGSIHYMAPEQVRGEFSDARGDLYSLGIVLYEMLTGQQPYTGDSLGEIAVKHMNAEPSPISERAEDVPEELERITLKAMNADIAERYQSAEAMLADMDAFAQSFLQTEDESAEEAEEAGEPEEPNVAPIRSSSELSKEKYRLRRRRASRVSFLSGTFAVMVTILALTVFLWQFWLGEIFAPAERISLPNFVGSNYDSLVNDLRLSSMYSFEVVFVVDPNIQPGMVLAQSPNPGRSMMKTPEGISVQLTVSSGISLNQVPYVINYDYRDASSMLRQAGFGVEIDNAVSENVTENYVISTNPAPGEELVPGAKVTLTVSVGTQISYVTVPNLVGLLSENAAISQIENSGLSYGGSERVISDLQAGTVIGQSIDPFTEVEEHSKVTLRISGGPVG